MNIQRTSLIEQLRPDRADRRHRHRLRRHHEPRLRHQQPVLRQAEDRPGEPGAGDRQSSRSARPTTPTPARRSTTPAIPPTASARPPTTSRRSPISLRVTPTPAVNATVSAEIDSRLQRTAHGVGEQQLQLDQSAADHRRLEPPLLHRGCSPGSTTRTRSTITSTSRPTPTPLDNRFGGVYSFNYDVLRSTHAAVASVGLLQRSVLRHRLRISTLQFRRRAVLRRALGPSFLSVVHPRRPWELLTVQRRDERRASLVARVRTT